MGSATTPQGLIANLNEDGTWNNVLLARGPDNPSEYLSFQPPGGSQKQVVSTALSNVLLQNQLFLIVSQPAPLGQFNNELMMRQFNFQLDIGPQTTILIFKYNTSATLKELVAQPSLWAESGTFVGSDTQATQKAILDYIKIAENNAGASGDPFGYFNTIANSVNWTGILAMNCAINGNGMPTTGTTPITIAMFTNTMKKNDMMKPIASRRPNWLRQRSAMMNPYSRISK